MRHTLVLLAVAGCFTKTIPSPEAPGQATPEIAVAPPPTETSRGQVALDTTNGAAKVDAILAEESWQGTYIAGHSVRTMPVCTTPCVASLPYGTYKLRFATKDGENESTAESVTFGGKPSVYRYTVGKTVRHPGLLGTGITLVVVSPGFLVGGLAASAVDSGAAPALILTGLIGTIVGGFAWYAGRTEVQDGAGTQWTPPDGVAFTLR